jgi:hypothetical protein
VFFRWNETCVDFGFGIGDFGFLISNPEFNTPLNFNPLSATRNQKSPSSLSLSAPIAPGLHRGFVGWIIGGIGGARQIGLVP